MMTGHPPPLPSTPQALQRQDFLALSSSPPVDYTSDSNPSSPSSLPCYTHPLRGPVCPAPPFQPTCGPIHIQPRLPQPRTHKFMHTIASIGHSMDSKEQSNVLALHWVRALLFLILPSRAMRVGEERRYSKGPRHPRTCGRSETSLDSDPKKEGGGGKKDSTTPDDDDEAPPHLCSGPGPATDERGYERKKWEAEGEKAGTRVCPA